jgi:SecD/SecF fusion protein
MKRHTKFLIINLFISVVILTACGEREKHIPGNLQFYETYFTSEISNQWNQAIIVSESEEVKNKDLYSDNNSDSSDMSQINSYDNTNTQKGLSDYVKFAGDGVLGFVSPEDKNAVDEILKRKDILSLFPQDIKFMWSVNLEKFNNNSKEMFYLLYACKIPESGRAKVGGAEIKSATTGYEQPNGKITIDLEMTAEGADKWAMMTEDNVQRIIAITMDNLVYSAPMVISPITGGKTQISGSLTNEFAQKLCGRINSFSSNKKL